MAQPGRGACALGHEARLRAAEVQRFFRGPARREESRSFVALWRAREGGGKVGFAVGRRIGGAVDRNRGRRRLREAYRRRRGAQPAGVDIVFVGRPAVLTRSFSDLLEEMHRVIQAVARAATGAARLSPDDKSGA